MNMKKLVALVILVLSVFLFTLPAVAEEEVYLNAAKIEEAFEANFGYSAKVRIHEDEEWGTMFILAPEKPWNGTVGFLAQFKDGEYVCTLSNLENLFQKREIEWRLHYWEALESPLWYNVEQVKEILNISQSETFQFAEVFDNRLKVVVETPKDCHFPWKLELYFPAFQGVRETNDGLLVRQDLVTKMFNALTGLENAW